MAVRSRLAHQRQPTPLVIAELARRWRGVKQTSLLHGLPARNGQARLNALLRADHANRPIISSSNRPNTLTGVQYGTITPDGLFHVGHVIAEPPPGGLAYGDRRGGRRSPGIAEPPPGGLAYEGNRLARPFAGGLVHGANAIAEPPPGSTRAKRHRWHPFDYNNPFDSFTRHTLHVPHYALHFSCEYIPYLALWANGLVEVVSSYLREPGRLGHVEPDCVLKIGIGDPSLGLYVLVTVEHKSYKDTKLLPKLHRDFNAAVARAQANDARKQHPAGQLHTMRAAIPGFAVSWQTRVGGHAQPCGPHLWRASGGRA